MEIQRIEVGEVHSNCYFVGDKKSGCGCIVDPGADAERLHEEWSKFGFTLSAILVTHGHFDHVTALSYFAEHMPELPIYISQLDVNAEDRPCAFWECAKMGNMMYVSEGSKIAVGDLHFDVLETPGHTPGSLVFRCEDVLFTGDTLFRRSCGRMDFKGGSKEDMMASLRKLDTLAGEYTIYPGHMDSSTMAEEREYNMFIKKARES